MYSRYDIPTFRNYQEALDHYNKIKPIRGHSEQRRPLGSRKHHYMHIRMRGGNLECMTYGIAPVTYFPDNTVEVRNDYRSNSTTEFMSCLLGTKLGTGGKCLWVKTLNHGYLPIKPQGKITLRLMSDGLYCDNPVFPVIHKVDLKAANAILKKFKPFLKYAQSCIKLKGDDGFQKYNYYPFKPEELLVELNDAVEPAQQYALLEKFVQAKGVQVWRNGSAGWGPEAYKTMLSPAKLRQSVREVVYFAHPELFTAQEVRTGAIVKDVNKKYVA